MYCGTAIRAVGWALSRGARRSVQPSACSHEGVSGHSQPLTFAAQLQFATATPSRHQLFGTMTPPPSPTSRGSAQRRLPPGATVVFVGEGPAAAGGEENDEASNVEACDNITKVGAVMNVGLAAGKGVAGVVSGSPALIADGVHSLSDLVSDAVTLWTMRTSRLPRDDNRPYGYGRMETIGALGVGGLLVITGLGMGMHSVETTQALLAQREVSEGPMWIALCAAGASVAIKEGLYWATLAAGKRANSKVVIANAWHHRSDAMSSLIAIVGVGGAMAGVPWLDPVSGVLVSGMIMKQGVDIGWDSVHELADGGLEENILNSIKRTAEEVEGVLGCHTLRGRRMGPYVSVELFVDLDPWVSLSLAHHTRRQVAAAVKSTHEEVMDIQVQVVPKGSVVADEIELGLAPTRSSIEVEAEVRQVVSEEFPEVVRVSHLTCHILPNQPSGFVVMVDLVMEKENIPRAAEVASRMQIALQRLDNVLEADIHLDLTEIPSENEHL